MHGHNGKNPELNSNCPFFINITKFKDGGIDKWHVTQVFKEHNHILSPEFFAHKILTKEQKEFIHLMSSQGISPTKITILFYKKFKTQLSREQIRYIATEGKQSANSKENNSETAQLEKYMLAINGSSFVYPEDGSVRQGIATFTKNELETLAYYGDVISIDPTFAFLSTHWTIIPITAIGIDRELRSGGLIFTSNTRSETFQWILNFFVNILPCKDKLNTIISDEDSGLDGAFTLTSNLNEDLTFKEKVMALNRIISPK